MYVDIPLTNYIIYDLQRKFNTNEAVIARVRGNWRMNVCVAAQNTIWYNIQKYLCENAGENAAPRSGTEGWILS